MTAVKSERPATSLTPDEYDAVEGLAVSLGVTVSAVLRLCALDTLRRYRHLTPAVAHEARVAQVRLNAGAAQFSDAG